MVSESEVGLEVFVVSRFGRRVLLWVFLESGCLFSIFGLKKHRNTKYDWKKTYIFL